MRYIVSILFQDGWEDYAAFAYHQDAIRYCEVGSGNWPNRLFRISSDANSEYVDVYYRNGVETSDVEIAA
jgi:hypothetical protein